MNKLYNFNGILQESASQHLSLENRAMKYGDSLFETIKYQEGKLVFFEDHYFRLMASMRMLRMEIPMDFTLEFLEGQVLKTIEAHPLESEMFRIRISVSREEGGLYTPSTNSISYWIEVSPLTVTKKENYVIDLFKDYFVSSDMLSTIKTNNRIINVLGSIYAKENNMDNCLLLNERKNVVELLNGNIFLIKGNTILTPPLTDGCLKGIFRKKLIEFLKKNKLYTIEERSISPFELQKVDEVFLTNSIVGIQNVTKYKRKSYQTEVTTRIRSLFYTMS